MSSEGDSGSRRRVKTASASSSTSASANNSNSTTAPYPFASNNGKEIKDGEKDAAAELARQETIDNVWTKLHSLFWISVSGLVLYSTDLPHRSLHDPDVNRNCLNLAVVCTSANLVIFLYATLYLPLVEKIQTSMDIYAPKMVYMSTFLVVFSLLLYVIAFWPLFGALTPFIILVLTLGLVLFLSLIPWPC